jgi:two-component system chemotaxis sensor kinase CheA
MSASEESRAIFHQEAEELLEQLADGLEDLAEGAAGAETVNALFRAVHSIKGGAAAFGLQAVVRLAHAAEHLLDRMRDGAAPAPAPPLVLLVRAADQLTRLLEAAQAGQEPGEDPALAALLEEIAALALPPPREKDAPDAAGAAPALTGEVAGDLPGAEGEAADNGAALYPWHIRFRADPGLFATGNEPMFLLRELCRLGRAGIHCDLSRLPPLDRLDPAGSYLAWEVTLQSAAPESTIREVFEFVEGLCELRITPPAGAETPPGGTAPPAGAPPPPRAAAPPPGTIRVELPRIERMISLVGELVIHQAMLARAVRRQGIAEGSEACIALEDLRGLSRQIQDSVMAIRAQPVKALFRRMARIAREVSGETGKPLRVVTEGAATEIDKTVIEKLADPLTHMIRNAVDHGIESSRDREAAGKPAEGLIRLSAEHRSGRVVITLSDDGGGIDRDRVRAIAEARGLVEPGAALSPAELDNLVFLPGFSTAEGLSALSGRGVGMDVVRRSIEALGGRIVAASEAGRGCRFTITLPLTLAVLEGMVIDVADQVLVVPMQAISETMRLPCEQLFRLGGGAVVRIRGSYVPVVDVGAVLGYRPPVPLDGDQLILLVEGGAGAGAALLIDGIREQRQVVIKGLEQNYGAVPGIAAATILGDGRVALILDAAAIAAGRAAPGAAQPPPLPPPLPPPAPAALAAAG